MAFVIFEDDYYEITLEITRDFIADDYDTFIDKEPSKETKIIKWELIIRFKKLINKQFELLEYHLEQAKEWISKIKSYDFYPNSYTFTIGKQTLENFEYPNCMNPNYYFITHNISTMYYPPSVSVIFYCNENKITNSANGQFNNYIYRLSYNILTICHVLANIDYYEKNNSIVIDTYYPRNRGKEITDSYKQNKTKDTRVVRSVDLEGNETIEEEKFYRYISVFDARRVVKHLNEIDETFINSYFSTHYKVSNPEKILPELRSLNNTKLYKALERTLLGLKANPELINGLK